MKNELCEPGDMFVRDNSVRVIKEFDPSGNDHGVAVIYALYRKQKLWCQTRKYRFEWVLYREGYYTRATFRRWLRMAEKVNNRKLKRMCQAEAVQVNQYGS